MNSRTSMLLAMMAAASLGGKVDRREYTPLRAKWEARKKARKKARAKARKRRSKP